jgi:ABC-type nickel/cobalt efflux system permease component RcnA
MTAKRLSLILIAVLIVYLLIAGSQGIRLIQTGQPVAIGLGVAILILPLIGFWIVWRELRFGNAVERMAKVLEAEGELPVDDLPRTEGGHIDRDAADAQFADVQQVAKADPNDWRAWFQVAASYDAAGDRKRARGAMYHAVDLFEATPEGGSKN